MRDPRSLESLRQRCGFAKEMTLSDGAPLKDLSRIKLTARFGPRSRGGFNRGVVNWLYQRYSLAILD